MAGLLNSLGIGWVRATFVVLTIRSVDLLFKTVFGSMMLVIFYHRLLREVLQIRRRAGKVGRHAWRGLRFSWRFAMRQNGAATTDVAPSADPPTRVKAVAAHDSGAPAQAPAGPAPGAPSTD
jgi:hypothetical protein